MTADPALGFWLRYAESEGALHDQLAGSTTMLLPLSVQQGSTCLRSSRSPLTRRWPAKTARCSWRRDIRCSTPPRSGCSTEGDVGRADLAWPSVGPLSSDALVQRIRKQVVIDHGRIDATTELPAAGYLPVLRVGALVAYTVTFDDRFQERQEVWVDATTGLQVPAGLSAALRHGTRLGGRCPSGAGGRPRRGRGGGPGPARTGCRRATGGPGQPVTRGAGRRGRPHRGLLPGGPRSRSPAAAPPPLLSGTRCSTPGPRRPARSGSVASPRSRRSSAGRSRRAGSGCTSSSCRR